MPTCRCSGFGRGPVTRWPQASLTWRGPVGKSCRRREFFPYLGFSPLWPKISKKLIHQSQLRLKATKLMTRGHAPVAPNAEAQTLMARTCIQVHDDTAI